MRILVIDVPVTLLNYVCKDTFNYIIFAQNNPTRCILYKNLTWFWSCVQIWALVKMYL